MVQSCLSLHGICRFGLFAPSYSKHTLHHRKLTILSERKGSNGTLQIKGGRGGRWGLPNTVTLGRGAIFSARGWGLHLWAHYPHTIQYLPLYL